MGVFTQLSRLARITGVFFRYAIDDLVVQLTGSRVLRVICRFWPAKSRHRKTRALPRGERLRLALQDLGPVFVKFGQMLSTRRDLLPDDISDQLALLQDSVEPFASEQAISLLRGKRFNAVL